MPTIVAEDVVQYTMEGTLFGQPAVNVLDFVVHDPGGENTREDCLQSVGTHLIDAWYDLVAAISHDYQFNGLHYMDLNTAEGSVGDIAAGTNHNAPFTGRDQGNSLPGNVAFRIDKSTNGGRGTRKGRFYLAGVPQSKQTGDQISTGDFGGLQNGANDFLSAMTETGLAAQCTYFMTVIHTRSGAYVDNTQVTALTVRSRLASQSRRLTLP